MHRINTRRTVMRLVQTSVLMVSAAFAGVQTAPAQIAVGISITVAPPALPVYDQPPLPAVGYIWTPGYWAWGDDSDYYWVPGTWVRPPTVGLLWTPGYWGWHDGIYGWNTGYWGPHVGFYGGINYGFGYGGVGFGGGVWRGGMFSYNTTVNNFGGVHVTNVYNKTVIVNNNTTNVSFNGGTGGSRAMPTAAEQTAARENHVAPTAAQSEHAHAAAANPEFKAANNGGHPAVGGTSSAGKFTGEGVSATHAHNGEGEGKGGNHEGANHEGGAHNAQGIMGGNHPAAANPAGGTHPAPAAAHPTGGNSSPKVTNAALNAGHANVHPAAANHGGKPPAGAAPHAPPPQAAPKAAPPKVASAKPPAPPRPAPPRPAPARPAPKGPPPKPHQ